MTIKIHPSPTADTRSCDYKHVSREQLRSSSTQHIDDVRRALEFFVEKLRESAICHDADKLADLDSFHADFLTGFEQHGWWDRHRRLNRHHLLMEDGIPEDVNLIDVLDMIADCIVAGMARTGTVYPLEIGPGLLKHAFDNTASMLMAEIVVADSTEGDSDGPQP
jgi:hypothetical protein